MEERPHGPPNQDEGFPVILSIPEGMMGRVECEEKRVDMPIRDRIVAAVKPRRNGNRIDFVLGLEM